MFSVPTRSQLHPARKGGNRLVNPSLTFKFQSRMRHRLKSAEIAREPNPVGLPVAVLVIFGPIVFDENLPKNPPQHFGIDQRNEIRRARQILGKVLVEDNW